ncbi:MAG: polysaccharide deacetylase family protein [Actinomycetota bacterium]|nr:polysaccharide deacetylase family protein [Actinomycetota bacterium]
MGNEMDQGFTAPRPGPGSGGAARPGRYRSQEPHHRRRRLILLLALAAAFVMILVLAFGGSGGGGGAVNRASAPARGFFTRIQALAGSGPGSFTAAAHRAQDAAIDRALTVTPLVRVAGSQHREVALTFDDGPGPYTPRVLSVLERTSTPGTFFEVGILEHYFHQSTSRIVADGFPIGDHTQNHAPMGKLSASDQESQIVRQISAIGAYGAPTPRLFRPPYGSWNDTTLALLRKYRMLMVLWTIDTEDYRQPGVQAIVHSVLAGVRPGAIVLLHDAGGTRSETAAALPKIIRALHARGYKLVTVPRLLLDNPPPPNQQGGMLAGGGG